MVTFSGRCCISNAYTTKLIEKWEVGDIAIEPEGRRVFIKLEASPLTRNDGHWRSSGELLKLYKLGGFKQHVPAANDYMIKMLRDYPDDLTKFQLEDFLEWQKAWGEKKKEISPDESTNLRNFGVF